MPRVRTINVLPAMKEWASEHMPDLVDSIPRPNLKSPKVPKVWTDATDEDERAIAALGKATFPVASSHKRFARDMQGKDRLTESQRDNLWRLIFRYRRQVEFSLVKIAMEKRVK